MNKKNENIDTDKIKKIAIDFDGVLSTYEPGMAVRDEVGKPLKGARCAMQRLHELGFEIIIWTSRPITDNLVNWFAECEIPYDVIARKLDCSIFVDDRAIPFNGDWETTLSDIELFKEWWRK